MNPQIEREIVRVMPDDQRAFKGGEPLFTAYGCVLLERDIVGKYYVYTAVNLTTDKREVIARRIHQLTTSGVAAMAEKIRLSGVAGAGRMQSDRPFGESIDLKSCRKQLTEIFEEILPQHGYAVRTEQVALAEHILESIGRRTVTLAEAEVGTGKTLAYLVAAILAKRGRLNGFWNMSFYTGTPYVETENMPIVIATSSIALQKALVTDYIPALSDILCEHGAITSPLTTALRKGREHYVCQERLQTYIRYEEDKHVVRTLTALRSPNAKIDLAETDGITPHIKRKISVPGRCNPNCPYRSRCAYLQFRKTVQSSHIDIQVCNHNYLLADILRRNEGASPLIPNYQSIIIDEAHKFLPAAHSMYGIQLSGMVIPGIRKWVSSLSFTQKKAHKRAYCLSDSLYYAGRDLFRRLSEKAETNRSDDEASRFAVAFDREEKRHMETICGTADTLRELLEESAIAGNGENRKQQAIDDLKLIRNAASVFMRHETHICWVETGAEGDCLCAIPKDINDRLFNDIWSRGIPTVLTSGTLSAAGDFSRIKKTLGLHHLKHRLTETGMPSPFNYKENTMLYISEAVPYPNPNDREYIRAVTNETEKLIRASCGHAAVLFTSYKVMDMVWERLRFRRLPFSMFRLDKGGVREIEKFKKSRKTGDRPPGVLFASGAMWEGIDIPGDALSMLIIVKLPFAVPDPISEYEQKQYSSMEQYKRHVLTPEMLIKAKQGFGRLLRTERDSGVVAFLDCRVAVGGAYRDVLLDALPVCRMAESINDTARFFEEMKPPEYFQ